MLKMPSDIDVRAHLGEGDSNMPARVTLDAMIPREDFAWEGQEFVLDLFPGLPIESLSNEAPILKLLRKPDFQRETNHWSAEQIAIFVASFLDNEVIPSLILWKSPSFIFVIDGGHRLSALRAWMLNDYGDDRVSQNFYNGEISDLQKRVAKRARKVIEDRVGRFNTLKDFVGTKLGSEEQRRRANLLFTRALPVQWIQGNAAFAETSFFKINSQGTPLDETETMLITNRRKPVAISARAILRAGAGHKYWSGFLQDNVSSIESLAADFHRVLFSPEVTHPLRTLDVPVGGSVSPVDALALLIEFLVIAGTRDQRGMVITAYPDDETGAGTVSVLRNSLEIINRITGISSGSLGLHPAVYFYNDKGRFNRFLFLGMSLTITEKMRNNDSGFFRKFTHAREKLEKFLMENKSLISALLQNMAKSQRVPKMRDLLVFLMTTINADEAVTPEALIRSLGLQGRIIDVVAATTSVDFSDDTKAMIFVRQALSAALICPLCRGKLDPNKSVSYDHIVRVRDNGKGDVGNGDLVHPYCNSAMKN
ncbi:GmrSD restriction endonuclease domain-containing protein [Rhodopila sp.]|uniref:GmrSD restriction endonuclease domain-containing protein n=1 Tax=Rhodopila sp. TaxID=2480087 RepID=UPI003D0E0617